jgi:hypothetical protein
MSPAAPLLDWQGTSSQGRISGQNSPVLALGVGARGLFASKPLILLKSN